MEPNEPNIELFMAFLAIELEKTGKVIETYINAISNLFKIYRIEWKRSALFRITLNAFKLRHPSDEQPKKPMSHLFIWWIWNSYLDLNNINFDIFACLIGMLIGYFLGCRPCEYSRDAKGKLRTRYYQLSYLPKKKRAKELVLTLVDTKTNKTGSKVEICTIDCQCGKKRFGIPSPCLLHAMLLYQKERKKRFGKIRKTSPLIVTALNNSICFSHMSNFLHKAILAMCIRTGIKLCPFEYTPHALRTGGTTDLARLGHNWLYIQKFGRWDTKEWQDTYVKLDFKDLAQLRNETITYIRGQMQQSVV